jgi:hypothetical protein
VRDALVLKPLDGLEQVLAEALEQVHVQAALGAQALGQGLVTSVLHEESHPVAHPHRVEQLDDVLVAELPQHLPLAQEPLVLLGIEGELERALLAIALHEEDHRRRALAEAALHQPAALQAVALVRGRRVARHPVFRRRCELVLDRLQVGEKVGDRVEAARDFRVGAVLDEEAEMLAGAVQDRRDLEPPALAQALGQLGEGRSRRLAGEEMVGDGAETEDVELLAAGVGIGARLGRHVGGGRRLDQLAEVEGGRHSAAGGGAEVARTRLPVEDLHAGDGGLRVEHQDALGAQRAVDELPGVRVLEGLGHLAEESQPEVDVEALGVFDQEVVEADGVHVVLEDEGRPELVLGVVDGFEDAWVLDALENLELALSGPRHGLTGARRPGGYRV